MDNACIIIEVKLPGQILYKICTLNIPFERQLYHVLSDGQSTIIIARDAHKEEYLSAILSEAQKSKIQAVGEIENIADKEESEKLLNLVRMLKKGTLPENASAEFFDEVRKYIRFSDN